jgi:hypothetical protein
MPFFVQVKNAISPEAAKKWAIVYIW